MMKSELFMITDPKHYQMTINGFFVFSIVPNGTNGLLRGENNMLTHSVRTHLRYRNLSLNRNQLDENRHHLQEKDQSRPM